MTRKHSKQFLASRLFGLKLDDPVPIMDISPEVLDLMMDDYRDGIPPARGLFVVTTGPLKFTAVDNSTGDMWTEDFDDRFAAEKWLRRGTQ